MGGQRGAAGTDGLDKAPFTSALQKFLELGKGQEEEHAHSYVYDLERRAGLHAEKRTSDAASSTSWLMNLEQRALNTAVKRATLKADQAKELQEKQDKEKKEKKDKEDDGEKKKK